MSEVVGEAVVELRGDGSQLEGDVAGAGTAAGAGFSKKFGSSVKVGLTAAGGLAAAAVAASFVKSLNVDKAGDKLAASLGATAGESARYGRVAGRLYAGAWGESMDEVNNALASVVTGFDGMEQASGRRIERLTAKALDFATAFDGDVTRAVQVAGQAVTSGLAKDATEAFDLITAASQKVPVALRADVLDAVDEYGPSFAQLGIDGEDAFEILVKGSEKGMYGIDKAGDAVKEFALLVSTDLTRTKPVIEGLGLDYDRMAEGLLAGGDKGAEATEKIIGGLLDMKDPAEQARAAVELFGTPIEDLNTRDIPEFLRSLQGGSDELDNFAGASKRMGDTLNDNASTRLTAFKRKLETQLVGYMADHVLPVLEDDVLPALERFGTWFEEDGGPALRDFHDDIKPVVGTVADLVGWLNDLPKPAKYAGLVALLGGLGASKLRSGSGALGGIGAAAGLAKPTPVFVTNPGFGAASGKGGVIAGGPGSKGGMTISRAAVTMTAAYIAGDAITKMLGWEEKGPREQARDDAFEKQWGSSRSEAGTNAQYSLFDVLGIDPGKGLGGLLRNDEGLGLEVMKQDTVTLIRLGKEMREEFGVGFRQLEKMGRLPDGFMDFLRTKKDEARELRTEFEAFPSDLQTHITLQGAPESAAEVESLVRTYDLTKKERRTLFEVYGITDNKRTVREYENILAGTEKPRKTVIDANVGPAVGQVNYLDRLMAGLSRTVTVDLTPRGFGARAAGGPVSPREAYLVGERGPELFSPDVAGKIIPNHQLSSGGGPVVYIDKMMPHNYGQFERQLEEQGRLAGLGGRRPVGTR